MHSQELGVLIPQNYPETGSAFFFSRDFVRFSEQLYTLGASPLRVSIAIFIGVLVNGMREKWADLLNIRYTRPDQ